MTLPIPGLRLSQLTIKDYKKIDSLEVQFPQPRMQGDADVMMLGSKNGGGKTSILECCSLLILAGILGKSGFEFYKNSESSSDIGHLLVRAGCRQALITGIFEQGIKKCTISLVVDIEKGISISKTDKDSQFFNKEDFKETYHYLEYYLGSILAFISEPVTLSPLIYFNSYRKVQESNPELGMMAEDFPMHRMMRMHPRDGIRSATNPISSFKLEILRSLMGRASLFEGINQEDAELVLQQLNSLIQRYCGGKIENLRSLPDNKVDIRIKSSSNNQSFSFDGLSSGQKEIIATLFLIWRNTQKQACIVIIDEPELHLNAEWHGDFIRQLYQLAPHNQYIMATHSEQMFASVEPYQRVILLPDDEPAGAVA